MARILVVEDEPDLQQVLAYNLRQAGHEPFLASTGAEGVRLALEQRPDLVLLDLMLPDILGTEVCRLIKSDPLTQRCAVVIVSAKGEEIDRVVGFELGADDYVVKPFSPRELMLRISAILRRSEPPPGGSTAIEFGALRIDREAHRVWVAEREVELTALEFRFLTTLYDRKNRVQSRETLLRDVWAWIQSRVLFRF